MLNHTAMGQRDSAGHRLNLVLIQLLQNTAGTLKASAELAKAGDGEPCWEESSAGYIGILGPQAAQCRISMGSCGSLCYDPLHLLRCRGDCLNIHKWRKTTCLLLGGYV